MNGAVAPSTGPCTGTRNLVERAINRLKQFRRIATRYEKNAGELPGDAAHRVDSTLVIVCKHALVLQPHLKR